jgi:hypothetical protein
MVTNRTPEVHAKMLEVAKGLDLESGSRLRA